MELLGTDIWSSLPHNQNIHKEPKELKINKIANNKRREANKVENSK